MSQDEFKPIEAINVERAPKWVAGSEYTQEGIRIYCTSSGEMWSLQMRAFFKKNHGGKTEQFMLANASMSRADLEWLREQIDTAIGKKKRK